MGLRQNIFENCSFSSLHFKFYFNELIMNFFSKTLYYIIVLKHLSYLKLWYSYWRSGRSLCPGPPRAGPGPGATSGCGPFIWKWWIFLSNFEIRVKRNVYPETESQTKPFSAKTIITSLKSIFRESFALHAKNSKVSQSFLRHCAP